MESLSLPIAQYYSSSVGIGIGVSVFVVVFIVVVIITVTKVHARQTRVVTNAPQATTTVGIVIVELKRN